MPGLSDAAAFQADLGPATDAVLSHSGTVLSRHVVGAAGVDRLVDAAASAGATVPSPPPH